MSALPVVPVIFAGLYPPQAAGKQGFYRFFRFAGIAEYRNACICEFILRVHTHAAGYNVGYLVLKYFPYSLASASSMLRVIGDNFRVLYLAVLRFYYKEMTALSEMSADFAFQALVVTKCNSDFHFILLNLCRRREPNAPVRDNITSPRLLSQSCVFPVRKGAF
jgi:hypothetical protein